MISGINPISSILSASSIISSLTSLIITLPLSIWSNRRPGVATITSTPLESFWSCSVKETPPISRAICNLNCLLRRLNSSETCIANSLVGVNIRHLGIRDFDLPEFKISIRGITKEPVFPVPVCAQPRTSLPISICGMAFR